MDRKLLEKFRSGKCTSEEVRKILLWYQSEEAAASFSMEIENLWNGERSLTFVDREKIFEKIIKKISDDKIYPEEGKKQQNRHAYIRYRTALKYPARVAAVVILLLLPVSLFFLRTLSQDPQPEISENVWLAKKTSFGQKYTLQLPDGTLVKLNSGSSIRYPKQFSDTVRWVEFDGEGFFEVEKDPSKPFVINSGNISTTVLGTSFNLKANPPADKFEVAVLTGSVKVEHLMDDKALSEQYLIPSQSAVYDKQNHVFNVQPFDPDKVLAWVSGTIIFDNSTFEEIVHTLETWYGVEIDTTSLKRKISKGYTGSYHDKSLETVLDGISYVLDFSYEIKGKEVVMK